jgi:hypothetical protein
MPKTIAPELVADTVIEKALDRFALAAEADHEWRAACLSDLEFSIGEQWDLGIRTGRERNGKPCLTMDQIQQSVRLVGNQYRQQPPSITVDPVGNGADTDTGDILQGIIRHIETNCDAQTAYENCHEGVVRCGFDSLRMRTEYVDDDSDRQEIIIEKIRNQFNVFWQPGVPQNKAKWAFIIDDMPVDAYKSEFPESRLASADDFTSVGNAPAAWVSKETIRVAEYFTVEEVTRSGKRSKNKVVWRKINAYEELEKSETLPGSSIPIFTAYGDDLDVNGKRYVAGLVRNAKGAQQMYNYTSSKAVEAMVLAPSAPWLVVEGQISGREKEWERANSGDIAVLQYKPIDVAGKPAGPPQRNNVEPPIQQFMLMIQQESLDLKAAMGIYDPSLGQRRGDESGSAIQKLQSQGNVATLNFADNMTRMMKRLGRSELEWIREVYDVPQVQRIINPDGTNKQVITHNGPDQADAAKKLADKEQIKNIYDIGVGRYDAVITVGPTYQSKRQEAVSTQINLLKSLPPQIVPSLIDLVVRNMDIPQSQEMADRLKKLLPPQLQDGDESDPQVQVGKLQAQVQQLGQQHQQLTQALEHSNQIIQTKQVEQQGKVQIAQVQEMSRQEIVKMQEATKMAVAQINASKDANQSYADREMQQYELLHNAAHDIGMQKDQQAHEAQQNAQQQATDAQSQQSDQQAEQQSQQSSQQADQQSQASDQQHQAGMAQQAQAAESEGGK